MVNLVGRVSALWRYPVKSMKGEELSEAFLGFTRVRGDRLYAFHSSRARPDFPYLTAREQPDMLLYRASWHANPQTTGGSVIVLTPSGEEFETADPQLLSLLSQRLRPHETIHLVRSEHSQTDAYPVSLFSVQTALQLASELKSEVNMHRFRANIYADLDPHPGFTEDTFLGHRLQIGSTATLEVVERDQRCKIITLDPETAQPDPGIMQQVARVHNGSAGVYTVVLVEGIVKPGDEIALLS